MRRILEACFGSVSQNMRQTSVFKPRGSNRICGGERIAKLHYGGKVHPSNRGWDWSLLHFRRRAW